MTYGVILLQRHRDRVVVFFLFMSRLLSRLKPRQLSPRLAFIKHTRLYSDAIPEKPVVEGTVFVDSLFPLQIGSFDFRRALVPEKSLLSALQTRFNKIPNFEVLKEEPNLKEGGVLVRFKYTPSDPDSVQEEIQTKLGQVPSWIGFNNGGTAWLVKGSPFVEDMIRYPSPYLKVIFEGSDVHEEELYRLFRPYGKIEDITEAKPLPGSSLRFSLVSFDRLRAAVIARNVLHGINVSSGPSSSQTRLRVVYEPPIRAHVIRDWISNHPKVFLPVLIVLLGSLTYAIFDPIRSFMIQGQMLEWFDPRSYKWYKWLRVNTLDRLYKSKSETSTNGANEVWKERRDAELSLRAYLSDVPTTIAFIHGPDGSGKTTMVENILKDTDRTPLIIDCRDLMKASSDARLINMLAKQIGYWPVFTFVNSMSSALDLASVGLIGQKAGLSSSLTEQVQDMLNVAVNALRGVQGSLRKKHENERKSAEHKEQAEEKPNSLDTEAVESLPIVVIRNFAAKTGAERQELLTVFSNWAASLAENQIAHVLVISDNRENVRVLAKALPTKPLHFVSLSDADSASSLAFIQRKLGDRVDFTRQEMQLIERLGGRARDLESLIHKMRAGQTVSEAVEDICSSGVNELRKNAFGDDADDAKGLAWTAPQAWTVLKLLAKQNEVLYHDVLFAFPFKGDEGPLRSMEHAELISINMVNGRPSTIKPGKPVFRYVFEKLVHDPVFKATQDIAFNEKLISSSEATIQACEQELLTLRDIARDNSWISWDSASSTRAATLSRKMHAAAKKVDELEKKNGELKKILAQNA
ncbi:RNA12 protein-domain-containing protein [Mycena floridula]|nr:RNA12 protein-domain-containing protein [Mycena floridula]